MNEAQRPFKYPIHCFFLMLRYFLLKIYPKAHPITFSLHHKQQNNIQIPEYLTEQKFAYAPKCRMMSSITSDGFTGEEKHFLGHMLNLCPFLAVLQHIHALKTKKIK